MEEVQKALATANKLYQQADHLTFVTYPLLKDTKLISSIADTLASALEHAMEALLLYERLYKRIPSFPENFHSRFDIFKRKIAPRYHLPREGLIVLEDLRKLVDDKAQSNMEFVRKHTYVLMNSKFGTKTITIDKLKDYLSLTKDFMRRINVILSHAQSRKR